MAWSRRPGKPSYGPCARKLGVPWGEQVGSSRPAAPSASRGRGARPWFSQRPSQLVGASRVAEHLNGLAADRQEDVHRRISGRTPGVDKLPTADRLLPTCVAGSRRRTRHVLCAPTYRHRHLTFRQALPGARIYLKATCSYDQDRLYLCRIRPQPNADSACRRRRDWTEASHAKGSGVACADRGRQKS